MSISPNTTNSPLSDPAYEMFRTDAGSVFLSKILAPMFLIGFVGIALNSSLIYVTIRQRSKLNGSFSTLIAYESLGNLCFELTYFLQAILTFFGQHFQKAQFCYPTKVWMAFGMGIMYVTMLAIGIERLICVLFPIWFAQKTHLLKIYAISVIIFGSCYGGTLFVLQSMDFFIDGQMEKEFFCTFGAKMGARFGAFLSMNFNWYMQMLTVAAYVCILLLMLRSWIKQITVANTYNLHILKSISIIMAIVMFCWILQGFGPFYWTTKTAEQFSTEQLLFYKSLSLDCMIAATLVNAPILYIFSSEYRRCYQNTFPCLKRGNNQQVMNGQQQQGIVMNPIITTRIVATADVVP